MKRGSTILISFLCTVLAVSVQANDSATVARDPLTGLKEQAYALSDLQVAMVEAVRDSAEKSGNGQRLEAATDILVHHYRYKNDLHNAFIVADDYLRASIASGDTSRMIAAYYFVGAAYFNAGLAASALDYFLKLLDFPLDPRVKCGIYYALGQVAGGIQKNQGLHPQEYYQRAESMARELDNKAVLVLSLFGLSQIYFDSMGGYKFDSLSPGQRDSLNISTRYLEEAVISLKTNSITIIEALSLNYAAQGQFDKALAFREKIEAARESPESACDSYNTMAAVYNYMGRYNDAITLCRQSIENARKYSQESKEHHAFDIMAYACQGKGDYREALMALKTVRKLENKMEERENQLELIASQVKFDIKQKEEQIADERRRSERYRLVIIFVGSLAVLLAVVIAVVVVSHRAVARKNHSLVQQIQRQNHLNEELKSDKSTVNQLRQIVAPPYCEEAPDELFERIENYMANNLSYTDPDMNYERLADALSINHTYLRNTIKQCTGLNCNDYINEYRLRYAGKMLTKPDSKITVKAVATAAGFGSSSTFYFLFKEKYGLSPGEFRKASLGKMEMGN